MAQNVDGAETLFTWDECCVDQVLEDVLAPPEALPDAGFAVRHHRALEIPQVLATSGGVNALYGLARIGVEQGGEWAYPLSDVLGSVRQWTDAQGTVLGLQGYEPYGVSLVPVGPPVAPWGYTGEWEDPSGLVYLRARWYDPALGRFTQVDPFPGEVGAPITLHPYLYGLNAPLRYSDPTGEYILLEHPQDYGPFDLNVVPAPFAVRTTPHGLRIVPYKGGGLFTNPFEWEWANFAFLVASGAEWGPADVPQCPGGAFGPGFMRTINNVEWVLSTGGHPPSQWDVMSDPYLVYSAALAAGTMLGGKQGDSSPLVGRGLWRVTKEGASRVLQSDRFGRFYKSRSDGLWWTRDQSGHGGSAWKVYKEDSAGLWHYADANEYGTFIGDKHKGPTGRFIPWNELHGSQ